MRLRVGGNSGMDASDFQSQKAYVHSGVLAEFCMFLFSR